MRELKAQRSKVILIVSIVILTGSACFAASPDTYFLEGNYDKAVSEATRMINSGSSGRDELYYLRGLSCLKLSRYDDARKDFNTILAKYPRSGRRFDADLGMGDSYFLEGNITEAEKSYEAMLSGFRGDKNAALIYYRIGCCYRKSGLNDRADYYFNKSGTLAPLSFESRMIPKPGYCEVALTKEPLPSRDGRFSVQVGSFKSRENAEKLNRKLAGEGYESFVDNSSAAGDGMYRVKIGRFTSKNEADSTAAALRSRGYATKVCSGDACQ